MNVHHVSARGNASSDLVLDATEWAELVQVLQVAILQFPGLEVRTDDPFTADGGGIEMYCAVLQRENLMFMPDGTVRACMMFIDRPGTNGYAWNRSGLAPNLAAGSELNQVESARPLSRCPAAEPGDSRFVGASGGLQVRCIYHKRRLTA